MKKYLVLVATAITLFVTGCSTPDPFNKNNSLIGGCQTGCVKDADLISMSHKAGESLMSQSTYLQNNIQPIIITSVADIVDIDASSAFGLMISEQIGDRFAQHGFPVIDIRTRNDIKIRENTGEFMLSRDVRKLSQKHSAGAILVGTYATGKKRVYVSTRLVRPEDNRVIAAYDFDVPMGPDTKVLIKRTP